MEFNPRRRAQIFVVIDGVFKPLPCVSVAENIDLMQDTVWVALTTGVVTAATALAAGWLTGRASVNAARVQVEAATDSQRRDRQYASRRNAYVDLLTYVTEVRWMAGDLIRRAAAGDHTALDAFRNGRRDIGRELARRRYLVFLEGPDDIADATSRLQRAIDELGDALEAALGEQPDRVNEMVESSTDAVSRETKKFIAAARSALEETT